MIQAQIECYKIYFEKLEAYNTAKFYEIGESQLLYHKQNLCSKALLIDTTIGTYGYVPFAYMGITEFGKEFLRFLKKDS